MKIKKGDKVIITAFELSDGKVESKVVLVDNNNQFKGYA